MYPLLAILLVLAFASGTASAQFVDHFEGEKLDGWTHATGDGEVAMDLEARDGSGIIRVDATRDRHNIWWALIKREVGGELDLAQLAEPERELRIETRIRVSHAPRRVNLHVNTQRTTDFHTHLMEFDIPDTTTWHTISMTTRGFDARPGDTVNAQMALMDWGRGTYRVEVDYFRVDVVDAARAGPDLGEPLPYHPPVPDPASFVHHLPADGAAVIDATFPDLNLNEWRASDGTPVLTVDESRFVILRWDFRELADRPVAGSGLLTLHPHSVEQGEHDLPELGQVRVVEILEGDAAWTAEEVTFDAFTQRRPLDEVVNTQMIIDVDPAVGDTTFATIPRPVMQRLLDGRTRGILLRPLGPEHLEVPYPFRRFSPAALASAVLQA